MTPARDNDLAMCVLDHENEQLRALNAELLAALKLAAAQLRFYEPVAPFIRAAIAKAERA